MDSPTTLTAFRLPTHDLPEMDPPHSQLGFTSPHVRWDPAYVQAVASLRQLLVPGSANSYDRPLAKPTQHQGASGGRLSCVLRKNASSPSRTTRVRMPTLLVASPSPKPLCLIAPRATSAQPLIAWRLKARPSRHGGRLNVAWLPTSRAPSRASTPTLSPWPMSSAMHTSCVMSTLP